MNQISLFYLVHVSNRFDAASALGALLLLARPVHLRAVLAQTYVHAVQDDVIGHGVQTHHALAQVVINAVLHGFEARDSPPVMKIVICMYCCIHITNTLHIPASVCVHMYPDCTREKIMHVWMNE